MLEVTYKKNQQQTARVLVLRDKLKPATMSRYAYLIGATKPFGKRDTTLDALIVGGVFNGERVDFDHLKFPVITVYGGSEVMTNFAMNRLSQEDIFEYTHIAPQRAFLVSDQFTKPVCIIYNPSKKVYERQPYIFVRKAELLNQYRGKEKHLNAILNRFYGVL